MGISSAMGSQALVPAGFGFRNLIINGDFRINQRGHSSSTANATFGPDRWFVNNSGGTATFSTLSFTVGNAIDGQEPETYVRLATSGQSAAGDHMRLAQKIENVRNCAGQTATVSFWAKASSGTPNIAVEFEQSFGTGGSPSSTVNGIAVTTFTIDSTWKRYTATVQIPSIAGKTLGTTANTSALLVGIWTSAGSNFASRTNSLGVQNITVDFWGVQVEANNVPTSFENRPIGVEQVLCQRYFVRRTGTNANESVGDMFAGFSSTRSFGSTYVTVPMRAQPTAAHVGARIITANSSLVASVITDIIVYSSDGVRICLDLRTGSGGTTASQLYFFGLNTTSSYVQFDAEL